MKYSHLFSLLFILFLSCHPVSTSFQTKESVDEIQLFNGENLDNWTSEPFRYAGEINVQDSMLVLGRGGYLTGVRWTGPVWRTNYEMSVDAMRIEGLDFFCGITFPVDSTHCSLIIGGWGGFTTGLSSINGIDASENGTSAVVMFDNNRWYHIRLRVTSKHIRAWVDEEQIVNVETRGKVINLRNDVEMTTPLSIMTFNTTGAVKNIRMQRLLFN